ncbi:MAG TPA: hypothetical protein VN867_02730, partial [Candidatus Binataceae bacterium]|nr:hypothetical protein [Candidatus Binataceae bacterium]
MTATAATAGRDAGGNTRPDRWASRALRDVATIAALALLSLMVGYAINRFSSRPLPLEYQTPEQRFDKELTTLVAAAPFTI